MDIQKKEEFKTEDEMVSLAHISAYSHTDQKAIIFKHKPKETQYVFALDELNNIITGARAWEGQGGICDHCGDDIHDSAMILDTNYSFHSFHPSCYTECRKKWAQLYDKYTPEITSFAL